MIRKDNKQLDKYRLFVIEYINNGFNGSEAYSKVYVVPKNHSAESMASKLLSKLEVFKIYQEELHKIGYDVESEYILREIVNLFKTGKKEATKSRMLELLSKIKAMYKEGTQTVAIFNDLRSREKDIGKKRLTQPTQPQLVSVDNDS